jgi:hypothetical protein
LHTQVNPLGAAAALLKGVATTAKLTAVEVSHLRLLAACRLSISVTLGAFSYQQQPDCAYLLLHAEPGWRSLEALWQDADPAKVDGLFAAALSGATALDELQTTGAALVKGAKSE